MSKEKAIVVVSGGMDSVTMLWDAVERNIYNIEGLSFYYGSKHNDMELPLAKKNCKKLKVPHTLINIDFIGKHFKSALLKSGGVIPKGHYAADNMKQTVVPFRNAIMLSIATGFAESRGATTLYIGAHENDATIYPDCRKEFMESMRSAIKLGTWKEIELCVPYQNINKTDIVAKGLRLGVDYKDTWTCYEPVKKGKKFISCGVCGSCSERREAFENNGEEDPKEYNDLTKMWKEGI